MKPPDFKGLQAQHEELLAKQNRGEDITNEVSKFMNSVLESSALVGSPRERDQLRAFLRYWASYIYEKTNSFPSIDLRPYSGPPLRSYTWLWITGGAAVLILVLLGGVLLGLLSIITNPTPTPVQSPTLDTGQLSTQVSVVLTKIPTQSPQPSLPPTKIPIKTTETQQYEPTSTPPGPFVELIEPKTSTEIKPVVDFSGTYVNLGEGWSIHVILQSIRLGGKYFPLDQFYEIPARAENNIWMIHARLDTALDLETPDKYIITLAAVNNDELRRLFTEGAKTGLDTLPPQAIWFQGAPAIVTRAGYTVVVGEHIVYTGYLPNQVFGDLYLTDLNGREVRKLTDTPDIGEIQPGLSPDGERIVFVANYGNPDTQQIEASLEVMDSNGQNRKPLLKEKDVIAYDMPAWSPDGRYIVYGAAFNGDNSHYELYLYDMLDGKSIQLTKGSSSSRYPTWMPDNQTIIFAGIDMGRGLPRLMQLNILKPGEVQPFRQTSRMLQAQPSLSPDGQLLAFVGYLDTAGPSDIFIQDMQTGETRQLTRQEFQASVPAWDSTGEEIFYQVLVDPDHIAIYAISAKGGEARQVTKGKALHPAVGRFYAYFLH